MSRDDRCIKLGAASTIALVVLYISVTVVGASLRPGYSLIRDSVSELIKVGAADAVIQSDLATTKTMHEYLPYVRVLQRAERLRDRLHVTSGDLCGFRLCPVLGPADDPLGRFRFVVENRYQKEGDPAERCAVD